MTKLAKRLAPKDPAHLVNAGLSFIGLVTCAVIGGELISDVVQDDDEREENFMQIPVPLKIPSIVVFIVFAALEANKVRSRLTRARGFK